MCPNTYSIPTTHQLSDTSGTECDVLHKSCMNEKGDNESYKGTELNGKQFVGFALDLLLDLGAVNRVLTKSKNKSFFSLALHWINSNLFIASSDDVHNAHNL